MQEVNGFSRIQKLKKVIDSYDSIFELEATSLIQKYKLIENKFIIPISILSLCSVVEKSYVGFSILEIKDEHGKTIGIRFENNKGNMLQIMILEKKKVQLVEYQIDCNEFNSIICMEERNDGFISTFEFITNKSPDMIDVQKVVLHRIEQEIENREINFNKIYELKRKNV